MNSKTRLKKVLLGSLACAGLLVFPLRSNAQQVIGILRHEDGTAVLIRGQSPIGMTSASYRRVGGVFPFGVLPEVAAEAGAIGTYPPAYVASPYSTTTVIGPIPAVNNSVNSSVVTPAVVNPNASLGAVGVMVPRSSAIQPKPTTDASRAAIELKVPAAATVWIQDKKMQQTGTDRSFLSPDLEPGMTYRYDVRVAWMENGREVSRTEQIQVQAGERRSLTIVAAGNPHGLPAATTSDRVAEPR